jgi:hypothetical protein
VDGRQSLISYRGKEGGEYYYGKTPSVDRKVYALTDDINHLRQRVYCQRE